MTTERIALAAFAFVCALGCAFHAAMSVLFVLPPNPVGESVRPLVLAYTHPLFEQYWNVFAPTPIEADLTVYARAKRAGAPDSAATGWVDISSPLIAEVRKNKLSLYSTLKVAQMTLAVAAKNDNVLGHRVLKPAEAAAMRDPHHRPVILEALKRFALVIGADALAARGRPDEVQLALADHRFPRFTHRFERDDKHKDDTVLLYPWLPSNEVTQ